MAPENVEEFTAMMEGLETLEAYLGRQTDFFSVTGEQVAESLGGLAPPADRAVLTGEVAETLAASFRAAGRQGVVGWRDDDLTLIRPWGFDLAEIEVPVSVWAGAADTMVPFRHGEWLAKHVAGARAHLLPDEGHISLMVRAERILDDLLDLAGLAGPRSHGS
jgi:pimeloyl-ACP methyl ester carboxylesterase